MRTKEVTYTGWGRASHATSQIARPERRSHLETLVSERAAPVLGQLRSYGDLCLNDAGQAIDLSRMDRITAFDRDAGTITVEAGIRIGDLATLLAPQGWLPAVMPGTGFATVGGAVANDVHGKNHHGAGSFGQHVTGLTLITPDGPKKIGPKSSARLFKATVGGLGQTGAVASVDLQLLRAKSDLVTVTERRIADWDEHLAMLAGSEATYNVGWIDATATGSSLGRGILEEAETAAGLVPPAKRDKSVPMDAPGGLLSGPVVKLFNAAYWRRVPVRGRTVVKPIEDFFFPLDKLRNWNRLYGKRGFHQFQCVVPLGAEDALKSMLERIAHSGMASPLAVLKRMGPGRAGMMSFPMEGTTLAVDLAASSRAVSLIQDLTRAAGEAGGRIYFAKDSVARAEDVGDMYAERAAWAAEVAKIDPERRFETDLVRRLKLRDH